MNPPTIVQAKDTTRRWRVRLMHETLATLSYLGTEPLEAKLWSGDNRQVLALLPVEWVTAPDQVRVTIGPTVLENLENAVYRLRIYVGAGNERTHAAEAWLKVLSAPGSESPLPVYCSGEDLKRIMPSVENLRDPSTDQTGYAEQRGLARAWFDQLLIRSYGDASLRTLLQDNRLEVTDEVKRANALYAIALICQGRIGSDPRGEWSKLADFYRQEADNQILIMSAIVDGVRLRLDGFLASGF